MVYRFADCVLDPATHSLTRGGAPVAVEPQVFDLLHLLARHPGELITKDRLIDEIWGGRIVSESAISARIAAARKAVGDSGQAQRIIATVARRGLRFVAEIVGAAPAAPAPTPAPERGPIHFARAADGAPLAWTFAGNGPPVIWAGYFPSHLDLIWSDTWSRGVLDPLTARFRTLLFDWRGTGLSHDGPILPTHEERAGDIASVVEAAGLFGVPVAAATGGCLDAIAFAALHPERVSALVLLGGYVEGRGLRDGTGPGTDEGDSLAGLLRDAWKTPNSSYLTAFGMAYIPDASAKQQHDLGAWFVRTTSLENTMAMRRVVNTANIAHLAPKVRCPTLVVHCRGDSVHPLSEARRLAALIPGAELLVLDSDNHVPVPGEPAFDRFTEAMCAFMERHAAAP